MYVNPFFLGVLSTIFVEVLILIAVGIVFSIKPKK